MPRTNGGAVPSFVHGPRAPRGPIVGDHDTPLWILRLEAIAAIGCVSIAALVATIAGLVYLIDLLAGH